MSRWRHVLAPLLLVSATTFASAQVPSKAATDFILHGASLALSSCKLPQRECNGKHLVVKSVTRGESNDEKRSVETLATDGMKATIIFNADDRSNFYFGEVTISGDMWPAVKGIKVGLPRATVRKILGLPNAATRNACDEYFEEDQQASALVCFRAGKVTSIRWEYFVD